MFVLFLQAVESCNQSRFLEAVGMSRSVVLHPVMKLVETLGDSLKAWFGTCASARALNLLSFSLHSTAKPHPQRWEVPAWETQPAQSSLAWRKKKWMLQRIEKSCSCLLTTPHVGGHKWTGSNLNEQMIGLQPWDLVKTFFLIKFQVFSISSQKSNYNSPKISAK